MKIQDIAAINKFNTQSDIYLAVVKDENGVEHLDTLPDGWCNRLYMWLGLSSASMSEVIRYVNDNQLFDQPSPEARLWLLKIKIESHQNRIFCHFFSAICQKICWAVSCLFCCRSKETTEPHPIPLTEKEEEDVAVKAEQVELPDSTVVIKKEPGKVFKSQFPRGFPTADFNTECTKLQAFLSAEISRLKSSGDADLIYVCMGYGAGNNAVDAELWPGFVLEHIQNGKTVHSLLFEYGNPYPLHLACESLKRSYQKYPDANAQLYEHLDTCFSAHQFLCGIPRAGETTYADLSTSARESGQSAWQTKEQIQEVHENFHRYIESLLSQGKQIVLSDHSGLIELPNYLVTLYNTLLEKYPKQLHFLWGWGVNAMTNQPIQAKDADVDQAKSQGTIWTHYTKEAGDLYRCKLPLI